MPEFLRSYRYSGIEVTVGKRRCIRFGVERARVVAYMQYHGAGAACLPNAVLDHDGDIVSEVFRSPTVTPSGNQRRHVRQHGHPGKVMGARRHATPPKRGNDEKDHVVGDSVVRDHSLPYPLRRTPVCASLRCWPARIARQGSPGCPYQRDDGQHPHQEGHGNPPFHRVAGDHTGKGSGSNGQAAGPTANSSSVSRHASMARRTSGSGRSTPIMTSS
ncbi:hypothetical protein QFZ41_000011 [Luteibacter sp. W1I16]